MTRGPDGDLYVSQWGQGQKTVARFNGVTGAFVDEATPALDDPMSHAWDDAGTLYVVNFDSADVRRFTATGELMDVFIGSQVLTGPVNLWFDGDALFVIDWRQGSVFEFNAATGAFRSTLISGMTNSEGWAIGPEDGRLYIADWKENTINQYDYATGELVAVFARGGGLDTPNDVMFGPRFPDFSITTDETQISLARGEEIVVAVEVSPDRALPFDESVALSCPSLPAGFSCRFAPAELVPGTQGATSTLTISTSTSTSTVSGDQTAAAGNDSPGVVTGAGRVGFAIGFGLFALLIFGGLWRGGRQSRIALAALLCAAVYLNGCGDDEPPTTVVVTVSGAAGDLSHSARIEVTLMSSP